MILLSPAGAPAPLAGQCWGVIVSFAAVAAGRLRRGLGFTRRGRLERLIDQSLRDGVGLHRQVFTVADPPIERVALQDLSGDVTTWVEQAMGRTRRPYGIDQMAVGLACAPASGDPFATVSLGVFRPSEYYTTGGLRDQIEQFVRALPMERINDEPEAVRLAAALFSWGDLARATVFKD